MLLSVHRVRSRAELTLSTGEKLFMPRAMLKERPYRGGTPFDMQSFQRFLQERSYPFALEKAVSLLALKARTEKELRDSLRQAAYPAEVIVRVIDRMREAGYINDTEFAAQWAASRTARGMGGRRISMELRRKGLEQDAVDEALSQITDDAVFDSALKTAEKAARGKNLSSPSDRQKITAALLRRGYDYGLARRAISSLMSNGCDCDS